MKLGTGRGRAEQQRPSPATSSKTRALGWESGALLCGRRALGRSPKLSGSQNLGEPVIPP